MHGPPEKSIAVLAFENMSADPDQEYFSDGISEELLNVLAKLPGLRVAARTSSFQFKGQHEDIAKIAAALNVAHILEGSVRKSGNKLRITAQLIKADDGFHLWSETYDRDLDDIFSVQDEIAGAISDALKVKLALVGGVAVRPTAIKAASSDAYDAYLQGRELFRHRGRENMDEVIRHLERSLLLDGNFAPAHAQLAIATAMTHLYGTAAPDEARQTAIRHLDRAQELAPDLAEAHAGRALLALSAHDPESVIEHARKALAANPSYIDAMNWLGIALSRLGRREESDAVFEQMLVTDPLSIIGRAGYASELASQGRIEEAHELADQLLAQSERMGYYVHAEVSLLFEGKIAEGLSWALRSHPGRFTAVFALALVGEYDEARRANESLAHWIDASAGKFEAGIQVTQQRLQRYPENFDDIWAAADFLYTAGRVDEALPLYERLRDFAPEGRSIPSSLGVYRSSNETMMRLAQARRQAGDEEGAQAAAQIARQEHAAGRAAGAKDQWRQRTEAMLAAFEHDPDHAVAALKSAMQRGLRFPNAFDSPIFEDLRDEPRFVVLEQELDAILAEEHEKVLQLICFNNPAPDVWQPIPETCEGVEEQHRL